MSDKATGASILGAREIEDRLAAQDIRLVFFDVDGTLLDHDGNYSQRLRQAVIDVRNCGIKTAIASGRPKFAVNFLINDLLINSAGLFYTGALVFDPQANRSLLEKPLSGNDATQLLQRARDLQIYTEVYTRDDFYIDSSCLGLQNPIGQVHAQHLRVTPTLYQQLDSLVTSEPVFKLLLAVDEEQQPGLLGVIECEFPHLHFAYACLPSRPTWSFVSVIDNTASKDLAFDLLLDYHQVIASQVLAFGDADSDRVFLKRAGVGVAMGNAKIEIQHVADIVTDTAANDGVANMLDILLKVKQ